MKRANSSRVGSLLAAAATLLFPQVSQASATYPAQVKKYAGMDCAPSCTLCHLTAEGGIGTATKPFGLAVQLSAGLHGRTPELVIPALTTIAMKMPPVDSDGDGYGDIAELLAMHDPNIAIGPDPATPADEIVCPPEYGCGARVAPRPPVDGSALGFALVVAGYLVLRSRRSA